MVAKSWRVGMNEVPELRVLQPPLSQETLLRKTRERVGADHPKVTQLGTELTQLDFLTPGRPGPPSAAHSSCVHPHPHPHFPV